MKIVPIVDHGVPMPTKHMVIIHTCQREKYEPEANTIIRKFKSRCGNTLEVHVTRKSGYIRTIKALDSCQANCSHCLERTKLIRELIAREYEAA
jgi:hypothetical protein